MTTHRALISFASSLALACAIAHTACAADKASATQDEPAAHAATTTEVIVTAQRRKENLQKAAFSGEAVSGTALSDAARSNVTEALGDMPSVRVAAHANGSQVYIRGVGSNADSQLGDPAINLSMDGLYQAETEALAVSMFDVNRIEVLRGPQGTLYGRNATAGVVNVITNDPSKHFGGYVRVNAGNLNAFSTEAAVDIPLTSTLFSRLAFTSNKRDGYYSNDNANVNNMALRGKLLFTPTDQWRILVSAEGLHIRDNDFGTVSIPLKADPYESDKPTGYRSVSGWNAHLQADYTLDWATLTFLAGHNDFNKNETNVYLGSGPAAASRREGHLDSAEFRLTSPDTSPVKWVAGLYALQDDEPSWVIDSLIGVAAQGAANPQLSDAKTKSLAGYVNVTTPLTPTVRVTVGARYTNDTKSALFVYNDGTPDLNPEKTWNSVTYKAELEKDLSANSLAYAQISTGFKAGGYAQAVPPVSYNPEKITAYEIGSKNDFFDHRVRVNLSAYYYDYKDYQASYVDILDGFFSIVTTNAATAKIYGGELETRFLLTPSDVLSVNGAYTHSRFGAFTYTSFAGTFDHSNQQMPNAPQTSLDVAYDHVFNLDNGASLTAHVNSHVTAPYWTTVERTDGSYQKGFTKSDAYLVFAPARANWKIRAYVNNIENKVVRTFGMQNPFDAVVMLAPPRTYGIGLSYDF